MSFTRTRALATVASLTLCAGPLTGASAIAQDVSAAGGTSRRTGTADVQREHLERQFRENVWRIAKERIGLSDDQMQRLQQTTRRFDVKRRALFQDERTQRAILRSEILADAQADQARVAAALDRVLQLQRQRVELQMEEQRELAGFMTPIQRAKFAALQEQVRRRAEAVAREHRDSTRPGFGPR